MSILRTLIRKQTVLSVGRRLCHGYRGPASEFDSSGSSSDTRAELRRARSVTSQTCAEAYCKCLAASQPCYEARFRPPPSHWRRRERTEEDDVRRYSALPIPDADECAVRTKQNERKAQRRNGRAHTEKRVPVRAGGPKAAPRSSEVTFQTLYLTALN